MFASAFDSMCSHSMPMIGSMLGYFTFFCCCCHRFVACILCMVFRFADNYISTMAHAMCVSVLDIMAVDPPMLGVGSTLLHVYWRLHCKCKLCVCVCPIYMLSAHNPLCAKYHYDFNISIQVLFGEFFSRRFSRLTHPLRSCQHLFSTSLKRSAREKRAEREAATNMKRTTCAELQ